MDTQLIFNIIMFWRTQTCTWDYEYYSILGSVDGGDYWCGFTYGLSWYRRCIVDLEGPKNNNNFVPKFPALFPISSLGFKEFRSCHYILTTSKKLNWKKKIFLGLAKKWGWRSLPLPKLERYMEDAQNHSLQEPKPPGEPVLGKTATTTNESGL